MNQKTPIIIVSGASGSGKTTLCRMVSNELGLYYSISYTTRSIRPQENNGFDYHFVTPEVFQTMIAKGDFLEWAEVYGNFYGTSRHPIEAHTKKGVGVILDVDIQGGFSIKKAIPEAVMVFVKTPSLEVLKSRLLKRGGLTEEAFTRRLSEAAKEEAISHTYDHVVVNEDLQVAYQELLQIVSDRLPL